MNRALPVLAPLLLAVSAVPAGETPTPSPAPAGSLLLVGGSGVTLKRLSPPGHDAARPRLSSDGAMLAYVRRAAEPGGEESRGDEIWIVGTDGEAPRRRIGPEDLASLEDSEASYSLHDLSWSPDGSRLAFTWYDRSGWARVLVSDPGGTIRRLPVPERADPWEAGRSYLLSTAQFVWDAGGTSGVMVAWDDECADLFALSVPRAGPTASGPEGGDPALPRASEIPLPEGCRVALLETDGYWLFRSREADQRQRLAIADRAGSVIASHIFDAGSPVLARWGSPAGDGPPPVLGWRVDPDRDEVVLFTWTGGEPAVWGRQACTPECPEPVLLTRDGIWLVERPVSTGRLVLMRGAGSRPIEVIPAGVATLRASADGKVLVAVIREPAGGALSIWRIDGWRSAQAP